MSGLCTVLPEGSKARRQCGTLAVAAPLPPHWSLLVALLLLQNPKVSAASLLAWLHAALGAGRAYLNQQRSAVASLPFAATPGPALRAHAAGRTPAPAPTHRPHTAARQAATTAGKVMQVAQVGMLHCCTHACFVWADPQKPRRWAHAPAYQTVTGIWLAARGVHSVGCVSLPG